MEQFDDAMRRELEGFSVDDEVELFTVDATMIGGEIYRFSASPVPAPDGSQIAPTFAGDVYPVIPFKSNGFEWSAGGALPRPTVQFFTSRDDGDQVSVAAYLLSMVEALDDLLGAKVYRVRTLRKFLDDGADANPQATMGFEVYNVTRKSKQTNSMVEFQLSSSMDLEGVMLPGGQVLNHCDHSYRTPLPDGGFSYEHATCPFVGTSYFDANGNAVSNASKDRCGRQLEDCKKRFGATAILPFGGFPGVGKFR